jgi:hypothetical protein
VKLFLNLELDNNQGIIMSVIKNKDILSGVLISDKKIYNQKLKKTLVIE